MGVPEIEKCDSLLTFFEQKYLYLSPSFIFFVFYES